MRGVYFILTATPEGYNLFVRTARQQWLP